MIKYAFMWKKIKFRSDPEIRGYGKWMGGLTTSPTWLKLETKGQ